MLVSREPISTTIAFMHNKLLLGAHVYKNARASI